MKLRGQNGIAGKPMVALLIGCSLGGVFAQQIPHGERKFTSAVGGYVVYYPNGWHMFPPGNLPTLNIYNFPFSRAGGGVLPDGGAQIAVVPAPARMAAIEDWMRDDHLLGPQESKSTVDLRLLASGETLPITEVVSRDGEGLETVSCYFVLTHHLLVGRVIYWPSDPKAKQYREVLHRVIESIRTLGP